MKRSQALVIQMLVLATMVLAFATLASPAHASTCLRIGEYYSYAGHCDPSRAAVGGMLPELALLAAMGGIATALVSLRRHVLRMRPAR